MEDPMVEKRKATRRREDALVRFDGDNFSIYSRATDVSDAGLFVATHYLLDPGTLIRLHLIDAAGAEESRAARVIRTMSRTNERGETTIGFGAEFVAEDPSVVV
jgi:hypothetical protein